MAQSVDGTVTNSEATSSNSSTINSKNDCRWLGCKSPGPFPTVDALVEHVEQRHLSQFNDTDFVACLWKGCKVFNRPFERKDWLPQHMRRHTNERPHKCFMNGCNMAFWSSHALQTHVQLHFKPSPMKSKKTAHPNKLAAATGPSQSMPSTLHQHPLPAVKSVSSSLGRSSMPPNGESVASVKDSTTSEDSYSLDLKKRHALKVKIPLNSNMKLAVLEACCQTPVPINGSIIHEDNIDLSTHSIIRQTLLEQLLVPPSTTSRYNGAVAITDARKNYISLKGKVIGRRNASDSEYLVRWSPMLVPDSWVPISNYTGVKTVALNDLSQCQKSVLTQCKYLSSGGSSSRLNFGSRKRKRV